MAFMRRTNWKLLRKFLENKHGGSFAWFGGLDRYINGDS